MTLYAILIQIKNYLILKDNIGLKLDQYGSMLMANRMDR